MITLIGIQFEFQGMKYYQYDGEVASGDYAIVSTDHGCYVSKIVKIRIPSDKELENPNFNAIFPTVSKVFSTAITADNPLTMTVLTIMRELFDVRVEKTIVRFAGRDENSLIVPIPSSMRDSGEEEIFLYAVNALQYDLNTDGVIYISLDKEEKIASKYAAANTIYPLKKAFRDKILRSETKEKEDNISQTTQEEANRLGLDMKVLRSYLDVNDPKVLITFISEGRVDFRELVRNLNAVFHLRIELRQIGPRDQAKLVGGIGPCGLPLCCSTFLSTFDGISIAMAKNQLLAINIPKLSGQCGKLMCCLKFEDAAYAEKRPNFPKVGEKFIYFNKSYEVTGLNLLTDNVTVYNGDAYETVSLEEFNRMKQGLARKENIVDLDINSGVDLSGYGVKDTELRLAQIDRKEKQHQDQIRNQNNRNNQNFKNNQQNQNKNNFKKHNNNNNNNTKNKYNNRNYNKKPEQKSSSSGFIPVSQITDTSVLNVKPVKHNDKK